MVDRTEEISTVRIPRPQHEALELAAEVSFEGDQDAQQSGLITIDRPLRRSRIQRFGQAVYWLFHREYRKEVRQRARSIVDDMTGGTHEKTVLPPRSRDFHISKRRTLTANFALDIQRQIQVMRLTRRIISTLTLAAVDQLPVISPLQVSEPAFEVPPLPPPVKVLEYQALPLNGYEVSDSDFISKLVLDE